MAVSLEQAFRRESPQRSCPQRLQLGLLLISSSLDAKTQVNKAFWFIYWC